MLELAGYSILENERALDGMEGVLLLVSFLMGVV